MPVSLVNRTVRFVEKGFSWLLQDRFAVVVSGLFFSMQVFVVRMHEMWRDEIQAWLFARDSNSYMDLLHNLRYEGHPPLWHSLLYIATLFTNNPVAMQAIHVIIASVSIFLFTKYAPFERIYKFIFSFGYLMFFEYGIVARNYNLVVLLLIIFCVLVTRTSKNYFAIGVTLLLLTQSHALGAMFLPALCLYLLWDFLATRSKTHTKWTDLIWSGGLAAVGAMAFLIETRVPKDSGFMLFRIEDLRHTLSAVWWGMAPIPANLHNYWGTNFVSNLDLTALLGIVMLVLTAIFLRRSPKLLATYLAGLLPIMSFIYFKNLSSIRTHGFIYVFFIMCAWLLFYERTAAQARKDKGLVRYQKTLLLLLLLLQLFGCAIAVRKERVTDFSMARRTADYIKHNNLQDLPMVGALDYSASTLSGFLNNKIYYVQSETWGSFVVWNKQRVRTVTEQEVVDEARRIAGEKQSDVLLVTLHQLDPDYAIGLTRLTGDWRTPAIADEGHVLYLVPVPQ